MDFELSCPSSDLPGYSPSAPLPSYSCELSCGERRLEHTPRSRSGHLQPSSVFVKKAGKTTIILNDQHEGVTVPSYGRQALIHGNLVLEKSESILEVVIKVEAKLDTTVSDGGAQSSKLLNDSYTLWSHRSQPSGTCPSQIPFSMPLPATFKHNGETSPLPPSYNAGFFSVPSLFVRSSYNIHVIISRIRHRKVDIWPKTKHILIPFTYAPRTRSHRPIIPSPCFFSSVKTSPEEWYQAVTNLKTRPNAQISPITCHLFVPAGRIYGLTDTIPFHIQLSGSGCTLRDLFSQSVLLDRVMSVDSHNTVASKKTMNTKPLLRVYILRQISVTMRGESSWKNNVIGEGTISPMPPESTTCCSSDDDPCQTEHIDWEGEVRCGSDITVGGFSAANAQVKDFIVLTLSPPSPHSSPLLEMQVTVPIRLVTDSFTETVAIMDHAV
ncbi:hypothetical protein M413DRAFT_444097 [Hebeloma cylindrosporum]|uniref:Arrestin-like N-terminal domain-containing protein n=1 Tax=Hebeloma cylindrosporum TaxID=76867 RepID=A0A0C2YQJ6_HEBCY|nr:hypothetical protein M413DRAFT_444097 [Hebeloma cylindrosporum h7]